MVAGGGDGQAGWLRPSHPIRVAPVPGFIRFRHRTLNPCPPPGEKTNRADPDMVPKPASMRRHVHRIAFGHGQMMHLVTAQHHQTHEAERPNFLLVGGIVADDREFFAIGNRFRGN